MAARNFSWVARLRRYRDNRTGRLLGKEVVKQLRDDEIAQQSDWAVDLAARLGNKTLTTQGWEREMRAVIKRQHTTEYLFGRGGKQAISAADRGRIGALVKRQYHYLRGFATDVGNGLLTEAEIAARAQLYFQSSRAAFELGQATAWGVTPPNEPGDGSTACGVNCRCAWSYEPTDDGQVAATWEQGDTTNPCGDCEERAMTWAPLLLTPVSSA